MLHRIFHTSTSTGTSPSSSRPGTAVSHESEAAKALLYPDRCRFSYFGNGSTSSSITSSVDLNGPDIDGDRDLRVLLVQDSNEVSEGKSILYDSRPSNTAMTPIFAPMYNDEVPTSPSVGGPFSSGGGRRRTRGATPFAASTSCSSSQSDRRDGGTTSAAEDEMRILIDCMFGSTPLAYKGDSTKVHLLPSMPQQERHRSQSIDYRSKPGRPGIPSINMFGNRECLRPRKWVLITRLFSVAMPVMTAPCSSGNPGHNANEYPFPPKAFTPKPNGAKLLKPPKTTTYAIATIISLPGTAPVCMPLQRCPSCYERRFDAHESDLSDSPQSHGFDDEYSRNDSVIMDGVDDDISDERMDLITKHWDVINRALSELQSVAKQRIVETWKVGGLAIPAGPDGKGGIKMRKRIVLRGAALMLDEDMRREVERFKWRVVTGVKIPRVVLGQGRWERWRDEAVWANGRFGGREHNFFFLCLLTAFLGHHTEWLDVLGPKNARHNHKPLKDRYNLEDSPMPMRTVIISNDKTVARRLIFLLSMFLPARTHPAWPRSEPIPPSRTSSLNLLSQSPPSISNFSQHRGSVRSSAGASARKRPSKLSTVHAGKDTSKIVGWDIPSKKDNVVDRENLTAPSSLTMAHGFKSKSNESTPMPSIPSAQQIFIRPSNFNRPSSSSSTASLQLMHTLKRSGTGNTSGHSDSSNNSGSTLWGSFLGSIWPNARTSTSTIATSIASDGTPPNPAQNIHVNTVAHNSYDDEEALIIDDYPEDDLLSPNPASKPSFRHVPASYLTDSPLSYTLSPDNVLDVEIPFAPPAYLPALSDISSPLTSSFSLSDTDTTGTSLTLSSLPQSPSRDVDDSIAPVAGYLDDERFHPDFVLQALNPNSAPHRAAAFEQDVKRSLRAEPTPVKMAGKNKKEAIKDEEILVSTILIANAINCTITRRQMYRRRVPNTGNESPTSPMSPEGGSSWTEYFVDDPIVGWDPSLSNAIDKVVGARDATKSSLVRSGSVLGRNRMRESSNLAPGGSEGASSREVMGAEEIKSVVLGSLERVVEDVRKGRQAGGVLAEGVERWFSECE